MLSCDLECVLEAECVLLTYSCPTMRHMSEGLLPLKLFFSMISVIFSL